MSQIDKLNYIPHLFWFLILFFLFYFLVFSYILPLIYQTLKVRELFLNFIINESLLYDVFYYVVTITYNTNLTGIFAKIFINFLKFFRNVNNIRFSFLLKTSVPLLKIV